MVLLVERFRSCELVVHLVVLFCANSFQNGILIYEGDRLTFSSRSKEIDGSKIVIFDQGKWMVGGCDLYSVKEAKVEGDIYQGYVSAVAGEDLKKGDVVTIKNGEVYLVK